MATRPSPPKPYERNRLTASSPSGNSTALTNVTAGSSSRPLSSTLTSSYASARPAVREEFARARASGYDDRSSYGGGAYASPASSYSSSLNGPRPPARPWETSRYGSYGSGYGAGAYGSSYGGGYGGDYYGNRGYGGGMYGGSYGGGLYGGGSSYLNPYSRDPKYLMGEPGFPGAIESQFGWVNDFGRIVDTFARISWLLDMNLETIFGSFSAMLRFFDRIRFLNVAELAPMVQAMFFLAGLGVAGAKVAEFLKGRRKDTDADIALFERQFAGAAASGGSRRSKHLWTFVLLGLVAAFLGTPLLFRLLGKVFKRGADAKKEGEQQQLPQRLRAAYDFTPETQDDLPLRAGDVVEIVGRRPEGWLEARLPNGRRGLVPETYMESLDAPEPGAPDHRQVEAGDIAMERPLRMASNGRRVEELAS